MATRQRIRTIGRVLRKIGAGRRAGNGSRPTFDCYEDAMSACRGSGYHAGRVEEVVFEKTKAYRDAIRVDNLSDLGQANVQMLLSVCLTYRGAQRAVTVMDFGGACGAHYFIAKAMFKEQLAFRWLVVETPTMVQFARNLETDELGFFDSIESAASSVDQIDLIYSAGTLQYVPDPCATLRQLVACGATHLSLARMGATTGTKQIICVDETQLSAHGPGPMPRGYEDELQRTVYTFPVKEEVDSIVKSSYRVMSALPDASGIFSMDGVPVVGFTYLAERTNLRFKETGYGS